MTDPSGEQSPQEIRVTRSGGIAGLRRTWVVVVEDQPDSDQWQLLISSLPWADAEVSAPQPDRYTYEIVCAQHRVLLAEQSIDGQWRELLDRVRASSRPGVDP